MASWHSAFDAPQADARPLEPTLRECEIGIPARSSQVAGTERDATILRIPEAMIRHPSIAATRNPVVTMMNVLAVPSSHTHRRRSIPTSTVPRARMIPARHFMGSILPRNARIDTPRPTRNGAATRR